MEQWRAYQREKMDQRGGLGDSSLMKNGEQEDVEPYQSAWLRGDLLKDQLSSQYIK